MFVYGLQHVMSMYAGVVAVPLIVGSAMKLEFSDLSYLLAATLLISGLATLLQTLGVPWIGAKLPIVQGTSFAAVASMIAIGTGAGGGTAGLQAIFGAIVVAGVIGFLLSGVFSRLLHFFPPVVTGSVITVIGISLLPVAIRWAGGGAGAADFGSLSNIGLAAITLGIILLIYRFLPGFFSRIAILIGLVAGGVVAALFGKIDFSRVSEAQSFAISTPFHFGAPTFEVAAAVSMVIVMLVIMTETTADLLAIGVVVGRPADRKTIANGLRADTLSTAVVRWSAERLPGQCVRAECRAGRAHWYQEPVRGRGQWRDPIVAGVFPSGRGRRRGTAAAGARGRRVGVVRHGCGQRHPQPVRSALRGQPQPDHRRVVDQHGDHPDRRAGLLPRLPDVVPDDLRFRHQCSSGDRRAAEHPVQRDRPQGSCRSDFRGRPGCGLDPGLPTRWPCATRPERCG